VSSTKGVYDEGFLDMLEAKLAVLRFQIKIKEQLEALASQLEASESGQNEETAERADFDGRAREKAKELSVELKSITELYNDYAVPFELWEVAPSLSVHAYCAIVMGL